MPAVTASRSVSSMRRDGSRRPPSRDMPRRSSTSVCSTAMAAGSSAIRRARWNGLAAPPIRGLRWHKPISANCTCRATASRKTPKPPPGCWRGPQFQLATMYCTAAGVPKDLDAAVAWYRRAAEQGERIAQYNLAVMLVRGDGVEPDPEEALNWYRKAAEQGVPEAQIALGDLG